MPENQDAIENALKQLLNERAELDALIAALRKRLGKPVTSGAAPAAPLSGSSTPHPAGEVVAYRGEFFGLSMTKAAEKLLQRVGRPLKTPEILDTLLGAGFEIKSKDKRAAVYTSLLRSRDFVKVLPDTWSLASLHPEAAAFKEEGAKAKKPKKRKGHVAKAPDHAHMSVQEGLRTVA